MSDQHYCRQCGKPIPSKQKFCSRTCNAKRQMFLHIRKYIKITVDPLDRLDREEEGGGADQP